MTASQMISILKIINNDLYKSKYNLDVLNPKDIYVRYDTIKEILSYMECFGPDIKKKQIKSIIKLEYLKSYSRFHYLVYDEDNECRYNFLKSLMKLFKIKL